MVGSGGPSLWGREVRDPSDLRSKLSLPGGSHRTVTCSVATPLVFPTYHKMGHLSVIGETRTHRRFARKSDSPRDHTIPYLHC